VIDDDASDEGEQLPGNPALREVVPATPSDRTAMIDLEALEARRAARRAEAAAAHDDDGTGRDGTDGNGEEDERTPPPTKAPGRDPDATGTLARARRGNRNQPPARLVRDERPADDVERVVDDDDAGDEDDDESRHAGDGGGTRSRMSRREGTRAGGTRAGGTRTGLTRAGQGAADGTRTGLTRATTMKPSKQRRPLSPMAAAGAVVLGVVTLIVVVFVASRATGVLTVNTVPHGAAVILDGEAIGTSPVQKRVRTGAHTIELKLDGYEPFREVVDVPSSGWPFLQPLKALPPPPPPPPTNAEIAADLAAQARRLFDAGDLDGALAKVVELERLIPDHVPSSEVRAAVRAAESRRQELLRKDAAQAAFQAQLARARQKAEEGRRLYDQGKLGPARTVLFEALKLDPKNPDPHRTLAKIFNRADEVDKVRYHLERFLELGGNDADFKVREWLRTHPK
jgi:hypothetical protein